MKLTPKESIMKKVCIIRHAYFALDACVRKEPALMRKPVIISKTRAVEEFFGPDNSSLKYFESGDEKGLARCILELYNSPETRKKMVNNAYAKFESVRWEKMQEVYCNLFL